MTNMRDYVEAVLERAVKSAAQAAILTLGAGQLDVLHADWGTLAGFSGGAFVLSVLTSLASSGIGGNGPSLTTESVTPEPPAEQPDALGDVELGEAAH